MIKFILIFVLFFLILSGKDVYAVSEGKTYEEIIKEEIGARPYPSQLEVLSVADGCFGCVDIVDFKVIPGVLPSVLVEPNNCNNGVLCIWGWGGRGWEHNKHTMIIGNLVIPHRVHQVCFELLKDSSGKIYVQESDGNTASSKAPLDETLSVLGKFDGQEFTLSYKKVVNPERKKKGCVDPWEHERLKREGEDREKAHQAEIRMYEKKKEYEEKYRKYLQDKGGS